MREVNLFVDHDQAVGQRLLAELSLHGAPVRERLPAARDEPTGHAVYDTRVQIVVAHELLDGERHLVRRVNATAAELPHRHAEHDNTEGEEATDPRAHDLLLPLQRRQGTFVEDRDA